MGEMPATLYLPHELHQLAAELQAEWPARLAALRASGTPLCAEDDDDTDPDKDGEGEGKDEGGLKDDEPWDEERARKTIKQQRAAQHAAEKAQRAAEKRARDAEARVKELEDAQKTDEEKREEAKAAAEREGSAAKAEALRLKVALRKGLTETQAKRLVGESEEELEADADELLASFKTDEGGGEDEVPRRPAERLRPGAAPGAESEETDPRKLAELVHRD